MLKKHIVITGSTRGIGFGLAEAFLARGCSVTVSGRSEEAVQKTVAGLRSKYEAENIFGLACDVTVPEKVQRLWDLSIKKFGKVDIWINNAGLSGERGLVWELSPEDAMIPIHTNILGTIYSAQVAVRSMLGRSQTC